MSYLLNSWYVAAWSSEVTQSLFARTLLDVPVLLYRQADGTLVAMQDMCPHRFAPLSRGTLTAQGVRCAYHGLTFDASGKCVANIFGGPTPAASRIRTFPTREQDAMIWIWLGTGEPSDQIPRFEHHIETARLTVFGYTRALADYRLLSDNLMDLTHTALVHPEFGGMDYMPKYRCWEEDGDVIVSDYCIENMPSFFDPGSGRLVRHEDTIRWFPAGAHLLDSVTTLLDEDRRIHLPSAHILTPETPATTHYFWSSAYDASLPFSQEELRQSLANAFDNQDKPMVEAVQKTMAGRDFWDLQPILLATDAGGVRMRRKLALLIEREREAAS